MEEMYFCTIRSHYSLRRVAYTACYYSADSTCFLPDGFVCLVDSALSESADRIMSAEQQQWTANEVSSHFEAEGSKPSKKRAMRRSSVADDVDLEEGREIEPVQFDC